MALTTLMTIKGDTTLDPDIVTDTIAAYSAGWNAGMGMTRIQYAKDVARANFFQVVKDYRQRQSTTTDPEISVT